VKGGAQRNLKAESRLVAGAERIQIAERQSIESEIVQLVNRFSHFIDKGQYEYLAELFTEDGEFDRVRQTLKGRAAILEAMQRTPLISDAPFRINSAFHAGRAAKSNPRRELGFEMEIHRSIACARMRRQGARSKSGSSRDKVRLHRGRLRDRCAVDCCRDRAQMTGQSSLPAGDRLRSLRRN
jgi:hypothetical protein